ncbi:MAG: diiron oxygenase [Acidimicrobiia bacterium]|nr:diiron oxygenase [Acidimicrobiia bacterium]
MTSFVISYRKTGMTMTAPPLDRVERLSTASVRRVLEPEEMFDWDTLGTGRLLPDSLLSVADLDLGLDAAAKAKLSREEVASMLSTGVRFEAALMAGFSLQIADADDLADPRITYMLHELGEETRHSRAFVRLLDEIDPTAVDPFRKGLIGKVASRMMRFTINAPALLCVFVLAGEEIPDLLQKRATEHPDTDPLLSAVNRYHRQEEARHLAFARTVLGEMWERAGAIERKRILHFAPIGIGQLFSAFVHPGVYETVGLPGMATWRAVNATPQRTALKHAAARPVLQAMIDADVVRPGAVPGGWRRLCGVDAEGAPLADAPTLRPVI